MKLQKKTIWILSAMVLATGVAMYYIFKPKKNAIKDGILTPFKQKLIDLSKQQYDLWNTPSKKKESDPNMLPQLRKYWKEGANVNMSDKEYVNQAWSAVFISWLMKMSGLGNDFKYSASHSTYIRDAIKNTKTNTDSLVKGYKPEEVKVERGDLVCYPRQSGVNYDTTSSYLAHCDLIQDIEGNTATSVGGNVSNSVTHTNVPLTAEGKIDMTKQNKGYFVVIKINK